MAAASGSAQEFKQEVQESELVGEEPESAGEEYHNENLLVSRLVTHYLCRSSEELNDGLELEVIDEEEEVGEGETGKAEDNRSKVG
jgi:hypothetical protein